MIEDVEQQGFGLHCEKVSHWFGETKVLFDLNLKYYVYLILKLIVF